MTSARPERPTEATPRVRALTSGPRHHFFGFHDLEISSRRTGAVLALSVGDIRRPPLAGDEAELVVLAPDEPGRRTVLTRTRGFNFPQGARQQWLGEGEVVAVNAPADDRTPRTALFDGTTGRRIGTRGAAIYCADAAGRIAYSVDFGRLHRLGGYGHTGMRDLTPDEAAPARNGIFRTEIAADRTDLLLSIAEAAAIGGAPVASHHYLTHPRLDPSGRRLAFLHRFRLPDGGEETRLMTVGTDGGAPRCLAGGFLSHFEWLDDSRLMIWGRLNRLVGDIRRSRLLGNPALRAVLRRVRAPLRRLMGRGGMLDGGWLLYEDTGGAEPRGLGRGVLRADGHPMVNPTDRDWLVTDTYPDARGERELMLYRISENRRVDLGRFPSWPERPDGAALAATEAMLGEEVEVEFPTALYAFTRSGLHCDLHPRWFADGRRVAFDHIEDGMRQVFWADLSGAMSGTGA